MAEKDYKKLCEEYEQILGIGSNDIAKKAFLSLCRIVNQQTKRLNKFEIDKEIGQNPKEDKVYDRTMDIFSGMPKIISEINRLRIELSITNKEIEESFIDGIAETRK
jgi:hypothetical protein